MTDGDVAAWPPLALERLSTAVTVLAERAATQEARAQLHGLAGILRNLGGEHVGTEEREALHAELSAALADENEHRAVTAMRALARLDRAVVRPVDWTAASGG
jgi:Spy/CpxP family protein refolding chaperone